MDILVSSLRPSPAVTSSRVAAHTLSLSRNSPSPTSQPLPQPLPTTGLSTVLQALLLLLGPFLGEGTPPGLFPRGPALGPGPFGFSHISVSRIQTQTAVLISKPEGEDSRALGQLVEAFSPLLGSEAPGKGQCPEPLEWLRFLTFWERPARGSEAVGVTQPGFSFSSRSRSGLTLRKNFLKMFAVRANLRPSSRGWPLPPLGSPASPVSPFSPPFSSSGKSSQLPTRSAKTLSPNTRGCRFRPRDINVEVQSSGSASSGPCWAQVWGSGSGVLGGVASSLPHTLLGDGNLALLVLPREAWLEGEQDPSH